MPSQFLGCEFYKVSLVTLATSKNPIFLDFADFMFFFTDFRLLKVFRGVPNAFKTIFSKKKYPIFSDFADFLTDFFDDLLNIRLVPHP